MLKTMENHNITGMLLQQMQTSMTDAFQLQHINAYHQHSPRNIDHLVEQEMKRIKTNYHNEEERFVEQMLLENPVIVERRTPSAPRKINGISFNNSGTSSDDQSNRSSHDPDIIAQQRAESCRKSRINHKIKKAKTKFRHKYITSKLAQSTHVLSNLRDIIAQAETQLLCHGYNQLSLQKLRNTFGLDRQSQCSNNDHSRKLEILTRSMDVKP